MQVIPNSEAKEQDTSNVKEHNVSQMAGVPYISIPTPSEGQLRLSKGSRQLKEDDSTPELYQSMSSQSSDISELKKYNKELQDENEMLKMEMLDFEQKLAYLEYSLGVVDGNGLINISTSANPINHLGEGVSHSVIDYSKDEDKKTIPDGKENMDGEDHQDATNGSKSNHSEEMKILLTKNKNMLEAIKALAKAAMTQKKKHDHYKNKLNIAKKETTEISKKMRESQASFYKTRSMYLQEKDKREELQNEINRLALHMKKLNSINEADKLDMKRTLQKLEKEIEDSKMASQDSCSGNSDSDPLQVDSLRNTEQIAQLNLKLDIAVEYMKKRLENESSETEKFDFISYNSTKSTSETEMSL